MQLAVGRLSGSLRLSSQRVTNTFNFTFESDKPLARHVLPRSYKQAMQWLDAQRRREQGIQVRRDYESSSQVN